MLRVPDNATHMSTREKYDDYKYLLILLLQSNPLSAPLHYLFLGPNQYIFSICAAQRTPVLTLVSSVSNLRPLINIRVPFRGSVTSVESFAAASNHDTCVWWSTRVQFSIKSIYNIPKFQNNSNHPIIIHNNNSR